MPIVNETQLNNASTDVNTISSFVNGAAANVTSRLGTTYKNLKKIESDAVASVTAAVQNGFFPLENIALTNAEQRLVNRYFEVTTGQYKPMYRRVARVAALSDGTVATTAAMGINFANVHLESVRVYGSANNGSTTFPLPHYYEITNQNIAIWYSGSSIVIRPNFDCTAYNATVYLEYAKTADSSIAIPLGVASNVNPYDFANGAEIAVPGAYIQTGVSTRKQMYRKIIYVPTGPNTTTDTYSHGISNLDISTLRIGGLTTNGTLTYPLPHYDQAATGTIAVYANSTSVFLKTTGNRTTFSIYIVLEYTKTTDPAI